MMVLRFAPLLLASWLAIAGCDSPAATPTVPSETRRTLAIVSGWDATPVAGAILILDGQRLTTDSAGRVDAPTPAGQRLDVDAPGFLPRRTRHHPLTGPLTLWPVANQEEAAAIRAMAFGTEQQGVSMLSRPQGFRVVIRTAGLTVPQSTVALSITASSLATLRHLGVPPDSVGTSFGFPLTFASFELPCGNRLGFCEWYTDEEDAVGVVIARDFASRPEVVLRALTSRVLTGANPLPGLMNAEHPATELSLLEQQTIKMVFLRPSGTAWPDTDRMDVFGR